MRTAGYATYAVGKWHVCNYHVGYKPSHNWPLQRGFDHYYGGIGGASLGTYFNNTLVRDNETIRTDRDPLYKPQRYYATDAFADNAIMYLQDHIKQQGSKPFFMYLAFTAAHWPLHAKEEDIAKYRDKYNHGYERVREERYNRMKRAGIVNCELSRQDAEWPSDYSDWEIRCMQVYAAQVDSLDQNVGKVTNFLARNKLLDNTLIFYLHDNGACAELIGRPQSGQPLPRLPGDKHSYSSYGQGWANVSNTPFRLYKHYANEGGIATPLIVQWPSYIKRRGELEHQPGHLVDIMTTCVEVSGATYPKNVQPMEGRSLVPAFQGKPIQRDVLFWEHEGNRALRKGDWKLVVVGPEGHWKLYWMGDDRSEMHDRRPRHRDTAKELMIDWEKWAEHTKAIPWPWGRAPRPPREDP